MKSFWNYAIPAAGIVISGFIDPRSGLLLVATNLFILGWTVVNQGKRIAKLELELERTNQRSEHITASTQS
jgi:hypothetical protein